MAAEPDAHQHDQSDHFGDELKHRNGLGGSLSICGSSSAANNGTRALPHWSDGTDHGVILAKNHLRRGFQSR
jgi:hypothetical protein